MNCTAALEALLDAEPAELAAVSTTPLTTHLAACERCRAVARQLVMDTRLLAAAITLEAAPRRMRRSATVWVERSLVPAGLVAALLLVLVPRTPDTSPNVTAGGASSKTAVAVPDAVMSPRVVTDTAPVTVQRPNPTRVRAYPAPIPVAAVRIDPAPQTFAPSGPDLGPAIIVDPPAGQRVAVMRTSNPKLTVVWLY